MSTSVEDIALESSAPPSSAPPSQAAEVDISTLSMEWAELEFVDADVEAAVARRWAPLLRLHPSDRYRPACVDHYVSNCTIAARDQPPPAPPVPATWEGAIEGGQGIVLTPSEDYLSSPSSHPVAVYGAVRRRPADGRLVAVYPMFFSNQPDSSVCFFWRSGGHVCDLEWALFVLSADGKQLEWAYLTSHGRTESSWIPAQHLEWRSPAPPVDEEQGGGGEAGARPVLYIAKHTHAVKWSAGWKPRIWFAVFESTSAAGEEVDGAQCLALVPPDHPWWRFHGSMGPDGCGSLGNPGRLDTPPLAGSEWTTAWRRSLFRTS